MKHYLRYALVLFSLGVVFHGEISAQTIQGVVYDENGVTAPGVTVIIDSTLVGSATNVNGEFSIGPVSPGTYKLRISFVGYKTIYKLVDVVAGKPTKIDFHLEVDAQNLDEFIVVGYGVQRKREVTGSISKIDSKEIASIPTQSFESALQGQASGVQVVTGSGLAGSPTTIRIRGISSISASGDPLYVVDGIPITQDYFLRGNSGGMNNNPLAAINPNDIESVEVLKDAAATGIYGSRGANGVILITTKKGSSDKLAFTFTSRVGAAQAVALPRMLNTEEYLQLYQEAYENDGNTGLAPLLGGLSWEEAQKNNTDWVDQTVGTGVKQLYSLSLNKKGKSIGYYGNFTYDDNQSYLLGNSYNRMSGRFNFDAKMGKKWKVAVNTSLSRGINNKVDAAWSGGLGAAMSTALPIYPIYWDSNVYEIDPASGDSTLLHQKGDYWLEGGSGNNPVAARNLKQWRTEELRSVNNLQLIFMPTDHWVITGSGGYDYMKLTEDQWESSTFTRQDDVGKGVSRRYPLEVNNYNASLIGNYIKRFKKNHDLNVMLGGEYQYSQTANYGRVEYSHVSDPQYKETGEEQYKDVQGGVTEKWAFSSFFARANYMFKQRYIFQVTGRVDGSSKFGPNNKFGFFPSASVGWVMSEESFMKNQKVFSYFKWRASYGRTGNSSIPVYQYYARFSAPENNGTYNGNPILYKRQLENPNLKWETTNMLDIAVEMGFIKDRIVVEASYYYKYSRDVLLRVNLPRHMGYGEYWDNVAEIMNRGWELRIKSRNLVGKFQWNTDLNIAYNYNEIRSIGPYSEDAIVGGTNDTRVVLGQPVGTNFLVRYSHVDPESGKPVYLDINGEQTYNWDPADRVPVGKVLPDVIGGMTNTFRLGNWDLAFSVVFSFGSKIYDSSSKRQLGVVTDWNMRPELFDRWRQPGDNSTTYPRLTQETETYGSGTPWINTDQWLHDADYLRFRKLSLGYAFNPWKTKGQRNISLRLEASITNFLTFTNYPGIDPEIARDFDNPADRNLSQNVTYLTPPQEKTYNFALYLNF